MLALISILTAVLWESGYGFCNGNANYGWV